MSANRFDFEQLLLECWGITKHLESIRSFVVDGAPVSIETHDRVANMLCGLEELYDLKFNTLFDMFEELVKQNQL